MLKLWILGQLAVTTVTDPVILDDDITKVLGVFVDESYVILCTEMSKQKEDEDSSFVRVDVRSTKNLQLIRSFWIDDNDSLIDHHYSNGLFITSVLKEIPADQSRANTVK